MPHFEIHTQQEGDKHWYVEPLDEKWKKSLEMAIAQAEVLVQLAREKGRVVHSRVVKKPAVGKKQILVWRSKKE